MKEVKKIQLNELGRVSTEEFKKQSKLPCIVILDNVRSAHNVGAIFRTSDGFGFEKILLGGITPKPPNKEISKTALGADRSMEYLPINDLTKDIIELKKQGYIIAGIEQTSESISIDKLDTLAINKIAFILGNEVKGVSHEILTLCDVYFEIPMTGTKHSFNVSVCNGIISWEVFKILNKKKGAN